MAFTDINSEDRLVQKTFAAHLRDVLRWENRGQGSPDTLSRLGELKELESSALQCMFPP